MAFIKRAKSSEHPDPTIIIKAAGGEHFLVEVFNLNHMQASSLLAEVALALLHDGIAGESEDATESVTEILKGIGGYNGQPKD